MRSQNVSRRRTEAVSEAENVTLFMSQFGRFILQNAHIKILKGITILTFYRHFTEAVSEAQIVT